MVELQGHGHTADIDRPLTLGQLADDVAALLKCLEIEQADFFGYSMGGNVALAVAIRHPKLVGKVAVNGSHYGSIDDAYEPENLKQFKSLPANFAPPILKDHYDKVAPDPKQWPVLVAKVKKMGLEFKGFARGRQSDQDSSPHRARRPRWCASRTRCGDVSAHSQCSACHLPGRRPLHDIPRS